MHRTGADELDPAREDLKLRRIAERPWDLVPSQLYNLDCNAYESLLIGLFSIWRGHPADEVKRPKINEVCIGFSRDGFHWDRPWRQPVIGVSEDPNAWNYSNVQSVGGGCLVVGDKDAVYAPGDYAGTLRLVADADLASGQRQDLVVDPHLLYAIRNEK